jgi:hypothetical protein
MAHTPRNAGILADRASPLRTRIGRVKRRVTLVFDCFLGSAILVVVTMHRLPSSTVTVSLSLGCALHSKTENAKTDIRLNG